MLFPAHGRSRGGKAARLLGPASLLLSLALVGCSNGAPVTDKIATVASERNAALEASGSKTEASSRLAGQQPQVTTGVIFSSVAIATLAPLQTLIPARTVEVSSSSTPTPRASSTPSGSSSSTPTSTATRTPEVTRSPSTSASPST